MNSNKKQFPHYERGQTTVAFNNIRPGAILYIAQSFIGADGKRKCDIWSITVCSRPRRPTGKELDYARGLFNHSNFIFNAKRNDTGEYRYIETVDRFVSNIDPSSITHNPSFLLFDSWKAALAWSEQVKAAEVTYDQEQDAYHHWEWVEDFWRDYYLNC